MYEINENYLNLTGNSFFSSVAKKERMYIAANPDRKIIRLGSGDIALPLAPAVVEAMHKAVDEMGDEVNFKGYPPERGYEFLRAAIALHEYADRGIDISIDEIFIGDGIKSDSGNIGDIFSRNNIIAVCDPIYPLYVDTNVMAGRAGEFNPDTQQWSNIMYLPCTAENDFLPELPEVAPDIFYLCFPNNPTGAAMTREQLQKWVDYAIENNSIIIFDAAYEAYISDGAVPHTIYECEGAKNCAIELRSFSKNAGFTGTRLGYTVVPKELKYNDITLNTLWARRQRMKFNGVSYVIQRAGEAVYSPDGRRQVADQVAYYMNNARLIKEGLIQAGYEVFGGINAPYLWVKTPEGMDSWKMFIYFLANANVIGTPGVGFGVNGEGYFRMTSFCTKEDALEAVERIKKL